MREDELELIQLIRESKNPAAVAEFAFTLILDYLRMHGTSEESIPVVPRESV